MNRHSQVGATQNRILAAVSAEDMALIDPYLEPADWKAGECIASPIQCSEHLYFPTRGLVSIFVITIDKRRLEVGMYGREGAGPTSVILEDVRSPHYHVARADVATFRIARQRICCAMRRSSTLSALLMGYIDAFNVQVGYTALSAGRGIVLERLARLLLMFHDRMDEPELPLTRELISEMLDVPQSYVIDAIYVLGAVGMISGDFGGIRILDKSRLKEAAGECYGASEVEYRRLVDRVIADC